MADPPFWIRAPWKLRQPRTRSVLIKRKIRLMSFLRTRCRNLSRISVEIEVCRGWTFIFASLITCAEKSYILACSMFKLRNSKMKIGNFIYGFILALTLAPAAKADIYDRINACQQAGGGTCIFDLLRELANGSSVPSSPTNLPLLGGQYLGGTQEQTITVSGSDSSDWTVFESWVGNSARYFCSGMICRLDGPSGPFLTILSSTKFDEFYNGVHIIYERIN